MAKPLETLKFHCLHYCLVTLMVLICPGLKYQTNMKLLEMGQAKAHLISAMKSYRGNELFHCFSFSTRQFNCERIRIIHKNISLLYESARKISLDTIFLKMRRDFMKEFNCCKGLVLQSKNKIFIQAI